MSYHSHNIMLCQKPQQLHQFVVVKALDHTYLFQHVCVYLQPMTNKIHNKGRPNVLFILFGEQFIGPSGLFTKQNPS